MQKGTSLMRNNLLKYTGAMLLLLACCLTSCIKEDYAVADKASVTLTFTTRANGTKDSNLEAGEGMKHLRVLVVDQATSEIRFNYEREFQENEISATVTFGDLYAGHTYDFYAIANEESFGGDFSGTPDLKQLYETLLDEVPGTLIDETAGRYLPAAAKCSLKIEGNKNQQLEIEMQRVVAKARVNFINQTGAKQQITGIRLVKVGAANTYLFPTSYDMNYTPNDNGSVDLALGDVTVSAPMNETASTALGYFYESVAPEGGYVLEATWNGKQKTFPLNDMETEEGIHLLEVKAEDAAGNQSYARAVFTIDHTPPEIHLGELEDGGVYKERVLLSLWVDGEGERLKSLAINGERQKLSADSRIFQYEITEPGMYVVDVRADDLTGNESAERISFEVRERKGLAAKIFRPVSGALLGKDEGGEEREGTLAPALLAAVGCAAVLCGILGRRIYLRRRQGQR